MKKRTLTSYKKLTHYINTNSGRWEQSCEACKGKGGYKTSLLLDIDDCKDAKVQVWEDCEECSGTGIISLSNEEYLHELLHSIHQDTVDIYNADRDNDIIKTNSSVINLLIEVLDYAEFKDINIEKELSNELMFRKREMNEK